MDLLFIYLDIQSIGAENMAYLIPTFDVLYMLFEFVSILSVGLDVAHARIPYDLLSLEIQIYYIFYRLYGTRFICTSFILRCMHSSHPWIYLHFWIVLDFLVLE